jgi:hypothetical protein
MMVSLTTEEQGAQPMSETIETKFYRLPDGSVGRVRIETDDDPATQNPRENNISGAVLVTWERDYVSPDKSTEMPAELSGAVSTWAESSGLIDAYKVARFARITSIPLLYIGALTRGGDGSIGIDDEPEAGAGYVGLAVVTADSWRLVNGNTEPTPEAARELAHAEVKLYSDWAGGDVFGYVAETPQGEIDSRWGFIGMDVFDYMFSQGSESLGDGAREISEAEYDEATDSADAA